MGLSAPFGALRNPVLNLTMPLLGFLVGGAIAGRSLGLGKRGVVGFAISFALSIPILLIVVISVQGMHGNEGFFSLAAYFAVAFGLAFALMGGLGVAISGLGWREVARSAAAFGSAGVLGSILLRLSLSAMMQGAWRLNHIVLWLGAVVSLLIPAGLGGTLLSRRLATRKQRLAAASATARS